MRFLNVPSSESFQARGSKLGGDSFGRYQADNRGDGTPTQVRQLARHQVALFSTVCRGTIPIVYVLHDSLSSNSCSNTVGEPRNDLVRKVQR